MITTKHALALANPVAIAFPVFDMRGGVERVASECARYFAARGYAAHAFARVADPDAIGPGVVVHQVITSRLPFAEMWLFSWAVGRLIAGETAAKVRCGFGVQAPPDAVIWVQSVHREWLRIARSVRGVRGRLRQVVNPFHYIALRAERRTFTAGRYRRLIALTPRVKRELIDHYRVPEDDVDILPNGFNDLEFNPDGRAAHRDRLRRANGIGDVQRVVLFVANELQRKGFEPLLRAIARLPRDDVHLWVVGRAPIEKHRSLIDHLGLSDRVRYLGSTSRVADYFHAADVFALPTQYEAWGLVIVEALACGVPVVTSRLAGAASSVVVGQTGELVDDPNDPIEIAAKLVSVLAYQNVDANSISRSVAHLTWSKILPQYERIVCDAFGITPRPGLPKAGA